jgi:hypothetical protein
MALGAAQLIFQLHGEVLRGVAAREGQHFQGLRSAAGYLRRRGRISNQSAKKLVRVDDAFAVVRHISEASVSAFLENLMDELHQSRDVAAGAHCDLRGDPAEVGHVAWGDAAGAPAEPLPEAREVAEGRDGAPAKDGTGDPEVVARGIPAGTHRDAGGHEAARGEPTVVAEAVHVDDAQVEVPMEFRDSEAVADSGAQSSGAQHVVPMEFGDSAAVFNSGAQRSMASTAALNAVMDKVARDTEKFNEEIAAYRRERLLRKR